MALSHGAKTTISLPKSRQQKHKWISARRRPRRQLQRLRSPTVRSHHLTLDGETYFAFNKSELAPLGREQFAKLLAGLGRTQYDTLLITGHTDRLGTDAYNKKLSERRARWR